MDRKVAIVAARGCGSRVGVHEGGDNVCCGAGLGGQVERQLAYERNGKQTGGRSCDEETQMVRDETKGGAG